MRVLFLNTSKVLINIINTEVYILNLHTTQKIAEANLIVDDIYTETSNWPLILLIVLKD